MTDSDKNFTAEELASAFWEHYAQSAGHNQEIAPATDFCPDAAAIERSRREDAVRSAVASVELEGLVPPQAFKELADRYIAGEVDLEALREYIVLRTGAKIP